MHASLVLPNCLQTGEVAYTAGKAALAGGGESDTAKDEDFCSFLDLTGRTAGLGVLRARLLYTAATSRTLCRYFSGP